MSFPQRPPMAMQSMGMQQGGYGFPPMGMMPVQMNMMPSQVMTSTNMNSGNNTSASAPKSNKKLVPQEIPKDKGDEKPPVTTVFVGNISERAPDAMIRQMLQRCGNVLSWKRVQGASGKLQAFGFCEYEDPEATLRCMRLLNDWKIADKELLVKVDANTKILLERYKKKKKARLELAAKAKQAGEGDKEDGEKEAGVNGSGDDDEKLDEFCMREDRVAKAGLDACMREYSIELSKEPPPSKEKSEEEKKEKRKEIRKDRKDDFKDQGIDDMELEEEKKNLINREINKFRDAHKDEEEDESKQRERERERERRRMMEEKERRERERERERREREKERERELREQESKKSRSRSRSRERVMLERRERERERERELEDEEDVYERKRLERKLREKEAAYQERLKAWEMRERKKAREYEKEKEKENEKENEERREAERLKEFLEDYDDERHDPKFYKGSALQRRLKEREKEQEADNRDRQREREEIEDIRRRLLEEGHPDVEEEMARIEQKRDEHLIPCLRRSPTPEPVPEPEPEPEPEIPEPPPIQEPIHAIAHHYAEPPQPVAPPPPPAEPTPSQDSSESSAESDHDDGPSYSPPPESEDSQSQPAITFPTKTDMRRTSFSGVMSGDSASPADSAPQMSQQKRKKLTVNDVFNQDEVEEEEMAKRRKLVRLDYDDDQSQSSSIPDGPAPILNLPNRPTTAEEKRRCIKTLIERIPTGKEELFAYQLDWRMVDGTLMDRRIKPWVNKKIVEYIGEEEPTLTDFICQKVMGNSSPQMILNDIAMVLDEEAEVFVVKMWRLLIYETEAKKAGLVK